jgi:hypothetical protein
MRNASAADLQKDSPRWSIAIVALSAAFMLGSSIHAQTQVSLPFGAGERITYRVKTDRFGAAGTATMWVDGPATLRGVSTLVLHSEVQVGVGPFRATSHTQSWLDLERMTTLRFSSRHRQVLSSSAEEIDVFPDEGRWSSSRGRAGETETDRPLDELSYIYFVRTLPLRADSAGQTLNRHYDQVRNPSVVRVLRRDTLATRAGEFSVIVVEMTVREPRCTGGQGVITFWLSDDASRRPMRIASAMPGLVSAEFTLESYAAPTQRLVSATP